MLGYIGSVYRYLPGQVKHGIVISLCIFKSIIPLNYIITCIIDFLLDPLKPHFYYESTGLRGSISHGDFSLMTCSSCIPDDKIQVNPRFCQSQKYCSDPDVLNLLF